MMKTNQLQSVPLLVFVFLTLFFSSCNSGSKQHSFSDVSLNHYQRLAISPELYKDYHFRDVYSYVLDFNFRKFRIPRIENGTITIEETTSSDVVVSRTLYLKDNLLIKIYDNLRTTNYKYDQERRLISTEGLKLDYTDGKLTSIDKAMTTETFDWKEDCVTWVKKDKNSDYTNNSKLCFNERGKITSDFSSYTLDERAITEEFNIQFDLDTIVSHTFIKTENGEVKTHHKVTHGINNLGLLESVSTEVVNQNVTYISEYVYEVASFEPLIISKFKWDEGQKKKEIRYTFNEKDQLIEYEQVGKYGEKYKVIYNEL